MNHPASPPRSPVVVALVTALSAAACALGAFTIPWSTISSGSGTSSGGPWSLSGTLGRHDAGDLSGGAFSIAGGYDAGAIAPPPSCPGDVNADGLINTLDLLLFLGRFGQVAPPGSPAAAMDFNTDGVVNTLDLLFFLGRFGIVCP